MRRMREGLELVFVTVFTGVAADVLVGLVLQTVIQGEFGPRDCGGLRRIGAAEPSDGSQDKPTD